MDSRLQLLGRSLDALPIHVAVLDLGGTIIETNQSWQSFGTHNGIQTDPETTGVNYVDVCERAGTETAEQAARGLSELLDGTQDEFRLDYPCHSPIEQRWFRLIAVPLSVGDQQYVIVAHVDITERALAEHRLKSQQDHLSTLNRLNTAVRGLMNAVIDHSTRSEIEQHVCTTLAGTDAYSCVWLGTVDVRTDSIAVTATAGDCEEIAAVGADADFETMRGYNVIRQAVWTRELQTTTSMVENTAFDWTDDTNDSYVSRSVAAVPICHERTLYNVCCLYTSRSDAFGPDERAILDRIGELVGHAIGAREQRRALMSDELIQVELLVPSLFDGHDRTDPEWTVAITQTVAGSNDDYFMYGLTSKDDLDAVDSAVDRLDDVELMVISDDDETVRIVLRVRRQCLIPHLADHGWSTKDIELINGDCYLTVHLPSGADIRRMMEIVTEEYPETELLARRQIQSTPSVESALTIPTEADLTDRQRTILETAYAAGYFEWPRDTSGEEIAETLGISSPTFHQHLRIGQKKLMNAIFNKKRVVN